MSKKADRLKRKLQAADRLLKQQAKHKQPEPGPAGMYDPEEHTERPEAMRWLRENNNPAALASNRFENRDAALEFVQRLYGLGARKVSVSNVSQEFWRLHIEGGPYSDMLIVELPQEPGQRAALVGLAGLEMEEELVQDIGQAELAFWWD